MNNYISRALIHHTHKAFYISIIEYIYIKGLPKKEAWKLRLPREQHHLDWIFSGDKLNTYNINPTAGSRLGAQLTSETIAKISGQNNHMFGKSHSIDTRLLMSVMKKKNMMVRIIQCLVRIILLKRY